MTDLDSPSRLAAVPVLNSVWWRDPVALLVVLAAAPFVLNEYQLQSLGSFMSYAIAASALAFVWGYCGILALGQAVFFGVGAYAIARTLQGFPGAPGIVLGLLLAGLIAGVIAWVLARGSFGLTADAFLISVTTFCLAVAAEQLALKFTGITGGQNGIPLDRVLPQSIVMKYAVATGVFALALVILTLLSRSNWGRLVNATRDNERRLRYFGTDVDSVKRQVFVVGAVITSVGGALDAVYSRVAAPDKVGFGLSTLILLWCALGGRRSIASAGLGALLINYVANQLSGALINYWQVILAVLFIIVVMYFPDGLYGPIRALGGRFNSGTAASLVSAPVSATVRSPDGPTFTSRGLRQHYGDFVALDVAELSFGAGMVTALIGPNGAGKTTLVNVASGGSQTATGSAVMLGTETIDLSIEDVSRLGVKRKFQNPSVFDSLSINDNLALGVDSPIGLRDYLRRSATIPMPPDVLDLAREHDLITRPLALAGELSHGSKQFLEVCMVLSSGPRAILLDEPTAGMTAAERARIGELMRGLASKGTAVLIIEHDFDFVRSVSDRILVMNHGRLIADGSVAEVSANKQVRELYLGAPA